MEELETVSLWSKKQADLTVSDSIKVALVATVVTTAAAFTVMVGAGAVVKLGEKLAERKAAKQAQIQEKASTN